MDLVALVASLAVAASMAPVFAISYDDMVAADFRYANATGSSEPHGISSYIRYLTIVSTGFGILAVILAVGVRASLALLRSNVDAGCYMTVPAVCSMVFFIISMGAFIFNTALYWWVMMPEAVAQDAGNDVLGWVFIVLFLGFLIYFLFFACFIRKRLNSSVSPSKQPKATACVVS